MTAQLTQTTGTYTYTDDSGYAESLLPDNEITGTYHYADADENYYVFIPADSKFYTVVHEGNHYYYAQESGLTSQEALEEIAKYLD